MKELKGSGVALITPFSNDNTINYTKLQELLDFHISNNTDFIVVCGTTSEASTLSLNEKKELMKYSIDYCKGKIPVVCGTGTNDTATTIELSTYAESINADGILVVTPYYNKCNEKGLYEHYLKLNNELKNTPIILYNVPSRTNVDISLSNIIRLSKLSNIVGIKEASTSLEKITKIIQNTDNDFKVFSGNDSLLYPTLSIGGSGVISVVANIIPDIIHKICSLDNDEQKRKLFNKYYPLIDALSLDINPIMIKYAMNYLGYNVGNLRMPLCYSTNTNNAKLQKIIDEIL